VETAYNEREGANRSADMGKRDVATAKLTAKGQITIPRDVRERLGLRPGDEIEFVEDRQGVRLRKRVPVSPFKKYRGNLKPLAGCDPDELLDQMRGR